ncbi:hypothetical protein BH23CHL5_BH23CHL5_07980 [soil metagenome]
MRSVPSGADIHNTEGEISRIPVLEISDHMIDDVVAHLKPALPFEGCGLIGGTINDQHIFTAMRFFPGTNADCSPSRFTMEPAEVIQAMRDMRAENLELVGIVHSHPASEARPSDTDLREWHYPDSLMLIVSFAGSEPVLGSWWIENRTTGTRPVAIATRLVARSQGYVTLDNPVSFSRFAIRRGAGPANILRPPSD